MTTEIQRIYNNNYQAFREGITSVESISYYSKWSTSSYEKDLAKGETYNGPIEAALAVNNLFAHTKENVEVLDIAAGTGYVGEELCGRGFQKIDALEPSEGMLEVARQKNIYRNHIQDILGGTSYVIDNGAYDCVVSCGAMGEGHIPCTGILEMIRITKPGGFVVIAMREEYLYTVKEYINKLEPLMEELESKGVWEKVGRIVYPNHFVGKSGILFIYQVK